MGCGSGDLTPRLTAFVAHNVIDRLGRLKDIATDSCLIRGTALERGRFSIGQVLRLT